MAYKSKHLVFINCLLLTLFTVDAFAGRPPPDINTCSRAWRLTSNSTALAFGNFSIDSGSGTISMSSGGALTTVGDIGLSSGLPVSTYQILVDNRRDASCVNFGFTLNWNNAPQPLTGPGSNINLAAYVYEPTIAPTAGTTFPIVVPPNSGLTLPFTLTLYGDISPNFPQASGNYLSPNFRVTLTQGTRTRRSPNLSATATSLLPISLLEVIPMDFGTVAGGSTASSVVLDTNSARSATGSAQLLATGPGTASTFQITGEPNLAYAVSFSASATLESPGGQQITANSFTNNSAGTIPAGGTENFQVGATLNLNPAQAAGNYSTTTGAGIPYTVTVNYN